MVTYRDMTFCINDKCKKKCKRYLTPEIMQAAEEYGLPVAMSNIVCLDKCENNVYSLETEDETDEEMS